MEPNSKSSGDFKNELGVSFERHSGILLSKILKREDSTYFNLKFTVAKAIVSIKQDLIRELFKGEKKEYDSYVKIKDLVSICDKYLEELKNVPIMSYYSSNKNSETDSSAFKKKIPINPPKYLSAKQKKYQKKEIFLFNDKSSNLFSSFNQTEINSNKDLCNINSINSVSISNKDGFQNNNNSVDEIINNNEKNSKKKKVKKITTKKRKKIIIK